MFVWITFDFSYSDFFWYNNKSSLLMKPLEAHVESLISG